MGSNSSAGVGRGSTKEGPSDIDLGDAVKLAGRAEEEEEETCWLMWASPLLTTARQPRACSLLFADMRWE